jgi:hypothetical protein
MTVDVKIDTTEFDRAMRRFGAESKRTSLEILTQQAKLFVRDIVRITPPSTGKTSIVKGKNRLVSDICRIVQTLPAAKFNKPGLYNEESVATFAHQGAGPVGEIQHKMLRSAAAIEKWHQSRRNNRGRVPKINKRATTGIRKRDLKLLDQGYTTPALLTAYIKVQLTKIGILASGWNAAATRLGLVLPQWITRHGTSRGQAEVLTSGGTVKIRITNAVLFAGDVSGMERRVQSALNNRAKQMDKQVDDYAVKKASRAAGFK